MEQKRLLRLQKLKINGIMPTMPPTPVPLSRLKQEHTMLLTGHTVYIREQRWKLSKKLKSPLSKSCSRKEKGNLPCDVI